MSKSIGINTVTVKDLIEMLSEQDPNLPVVFGYDYGDHCHSTIAGKVHHVDIGTIRYSEYHRQHVVANEKEEEPEGVEALIIG